MHYFVCEFVDGGKDVATKAALLTKFCMCSEIELCINGNWRKRLQ